jgi:hypothetical protein
MDLFGDPAGRPPARGQPARLAKRSAFCRFLAVVVHKPKFLNNSNILKFRIFLSVGKGAVINDPVFFIL